MITRRARMVARSEPQTMRAHRVGQSVSRWTTEFAASRRSFLRVGAAYAFAQLAPSGVPWGAAQVQPVRLDDLPRLDGEFRLDDAARSAAAVDYRRAVRRLAPAAPQAPTVPHSR